MIDCTELQSSRNWPSTPTTAFFRLAPPPPPKVQSVYAHHLLLFSHILPIGLQLKQSLYKLRTGGIQNLYFYYSQQRLCFMHYDAWLNVQSDPWQVKKKRGSYVFFNQNVKSVKILMMSGMPFCFYVLDFWHLYTSAMITWDKFILIDKEAVCNKN